MTKVKALKKRKTALPENVVVHALFNGDKELTPHVDWKIDSGNLIVTKRLKQEIADRKIKLVYQLGLISVANSWMLT